MTNPARFLCSCAVCATAISCASCKIIQPIFVEQHSSRPYADGRFVGKPTLELIEVGNTTEEWVHTMLGEPTSTDTVYSAQRKIVRYEYEPVRNGNEIAYRILDANERRGRIVRAIHFEISQGIVQRWWIE